MVTRKFLWVSILSLLLCYILWYYHCPNWLIILASFAGFIAGVLACFWTQPFGFYNNVFLMLPGMLDAVTDGRLRGDSDYDEIAGVLGIIVAFLNMFVFIKFLFMLLKG